MQPKKNRNNPAAFLVIGLGSGVVIGVANGHAALGIVLGAAFGMVLMLIARRREQDENEE